ncbi:Acetyltransferase (GNAT) domain [Corynebacterium mustelae]|uniref:Acetyltransferase (GNAT) domain n=1 Tax=Corynebacterium mustelae TaxID=571915 RepID=A0A0G3H5E5_9CORY|nr:GNAT family N-acetyltransferase [Corynebacterium mustelae]AKK07058.1 Acetyltransferase (GNAT) domain [Corynebacterium mustelae]
MTMDQVSQYRLMYESAMRGEADVRGMSDMQVHRMGPVWVAESSNRGWALVSYSPEQAREIRASHIQDVIDFLASSGSIRSVEWKTWRSDPSLPLDNFGFSFEPEETVMMGDPQVLAQWPNPDGVRVHQVLTESDLEAASNVRSEIFGLNQTRTRQFVERTRHDIEGAGLFAAVADSHIVGLGRMEELSGAGIVGLFSGAVLPQYRGRGIYRALLSARAKRALDVGATVVMSECSAYSRPILSRAGFMAVEHTTPAIYRFDSA